MVELSFFNNIKDFIDELYELLKEDWKKFKTFVKENKNYIIWSIIAIMTLQITDIMKIGSSFNIYCKNNNIQYGGSSASAPPPLPPPRVNRTTKPVETPKQTDAPKQLDTPKPDAPKPDAGGEEGGENETKDVQKKLDLFNKLKGRVKDSAGKHGMMGPVFNNLDGIFGALEGIFTLVAVILIIIGIISLPIFIFLIITYCIIKYLVGKLLLF